MREPPLWLSLSRSLFALLIILAKRLRYTRLTSRSRPIPNTSKTVHPELAAGLPPVVNRMRALPSTPSPASQDIQYLLRHDCGGHRLSTSLADERAFSRLDAIFSLESWSVYVRRTDEAYKSAIWSHLHVQGLCQASNGELGGRVCGITGQATQACQGRDQHDATTALLLEGGHQRGEAVDSTEAMKVELCAVSSRRQLLEIAGHRRAR